MPEILSEILGVGAGSKTVQRSYHEVLERLGPELEVLWNLDMDELRASASPMLVEALERLRAGKVIAKPGFDGEYGTVRLFEEGELQKDRRLAFSFFSHDDSAKASEKSQGPDSGVESPNKKSGLNPLVSGDSSENTRNNSGSLDGGMDAEQILAVEHPARVILVEAGPGSGKTRVLTERIAYLVSSGKARAEKCIAITFTNRAAEEIGERLRQLLPESGELVQVMTMHSLGYQILRSYAHEAGLAPDFYIADERERMDLLLDEWKLSERKARKALSSISRLKSWVNPKISEEDARLLKRYEQLLSAHNMVDFDDLIGKTVELLATNKETFGQLRAIHEHIFIDEVQDLDPKQERLVELLVGHEAHLCAIGDPDQSIYGFRGVVPGVFHRFAHIFGDCVRIRLKHNYRSADAIVSGSVGVMNHADGKRRELEAVVRSTHLIGMHTAPTDKAEAEFIVHSLEQLIGGHSFFSLDSGRSTDGAEPDLGFGDVAVLYRTEAQSSLFVEALERSGIPYRVFSHKALMLQPAVRAITQNLRQHPGKGDILRRIKRRLPSIAKEHENILPKQLDEALEALAGIAQGCGEDTEAFFAELVLNSQVDSFDPRSQRVSLMTIHSSKGLEFPVVFLTGCENGLLPLSFGGKLASDLDEERRLFYVGMTRAMSRLFLTRAERRLLQGTMRKQPPSPFLLDVEKELTENINKKLPRTRRKKKEQLHLF